MVSQLDAIISGVWTLLSMAITAGAVYGLSNLFKPRNPRRELQRRVTEHMALQWGVSRRWWETDRSHRRRIANKVERG